MDDLSVAVPMLPLLFVGLIALAAAQSLIAWGAATYVFRARTSARLIAGLLFSPMLTMGGTCYIYVHQRDPEAIQAGLVLALVGIGFSIIALLLAENRFGHQLP